MRRIFTKKPKKSATDKKPNMREQVFSQLCETREKLTREHPELMKRMRILTTLSQQQPTEQPSELAIDKQKNVSTILQFLELKDDQPGLNAAVKAALKQHLH